MTDKMPDSKEKVSDESSQGATTEPSGPKEEQVEDSGASAPKAGIQSEASALLKKLKRKRDADDGAEVAVDEKDAKETKRKTTAKCSKPHTDGIDLEGRFEWQSCMLGIPEKHIESQRRRPVWGYACALNDCSAATRNKEQELMAVTMKRKVEQVFYDMHTDHHFWDKFSCFPMTMTSDILADLIKKKQIKSENCCLCKQPFEGWQHYERKLCGKHLMHLHCPGKEHENTLKALRGECSCARVELEKEEKETKG